MIDHVSIAVRDLAAATAFYEAVLAPLGMTKLETRPATVGFGKKYAEFWINLRKDMAPAAPTNGAHVACARARPKSSMRSTPRHLRRAVPATGRRVCGRSTAKATTPPSSAIPDGNRIEAVTFVGK